MPTGWSNPKQLGGGVRFTPARLYFTVTDAVVRWLSGLEVPAKVSL